MLYWNLCTHMPHKTTVDCCGAEGQWERATHKTALLHTYVCGADRQCMSTEGSLLEVLFHHGHDVLVQRANHHILQGTLQHFVKQLAPLIHTPGKNSTADKGSSAKAASL